MTAAPGAHTTQALAWLRCQPRSRLALAGAGGVALVLAALVAAVLVPHWQQQAADEHRAWQTERRSARARPAVAPAPAALPWTAELPGSPDNEARVAALLRSAEQNGVQVQRSQQQWATGAPAAAGQPVIAVLQLSMQVVAPYAALRSWAAQALAADPHLALDALRLQRSNAGQTALTAELQWALLLQADRDSAPAPAAVATPQRGAP